MRASHCCSDTAFVCNIYIFFSTLVLVENRKRSEAHTRLRGEAVCGQSIVVISTCCCVLGA